MGLGLIDRSELSQGAGRLAVPLSQTMLDRLCVYLQELQRWSRIVNLVSSPDPQTVIRKHVLDSLALSGQIDQKTNRLAFEGRLGDLGSGAGFPGLVLAMAEPNRPIDLIEARRKRAHFLKAVVRKLELSNVTVYEGRAEDLLRQEQFRAVYRAVVSRATWKLEQFLSLAGDFIDRNGWVIAMKGPGVEGELRHVLARDHPFALYARYNYTLPFGTESRTLLIFAKKQVKCSM